MNNTITNPERNIPDFAISPLLTLEISKYAEIYKGDNEEKNDNIFFKFGSNPGFAPNTSFMNWLLGVNSGAGAGAGAEDIFI
jgi:hypothetical protein